MKNILKLSAIFAFCLAAAGLWSCSNEELDTDQFSGRVALSAIAPNPVMRGGTLTIIGSNLEKVTEVRFTGGTTASSLTVVKAGTPGELQAQIPMEGPEPGPVSIVTDDGTILTTLAELTFTEPIEIDSFSPAEVLSGDVLTITGEYLNDVQEVIFGGDVYVTEFASQSRYELKVVVPSNAVTGYVIVGDVNQLVDESTIPNLIYTASELTVGKPEVATAAKATYKAGSTITVSGSHLDMIQTVNLTGASAVEFTVAEDGNSLSFTLPVSATDGNIELVSYAGDSFIAGEIETVSVADLAIATKAEDGRYKAGCTVEITGSDLDLVTAVDFVNASASYYYSDGKLITTLPETAKDGAVTVTLASGKQASTPAIEVVKPVVSGVDLTEATAGQTTLTLSGTDLDLVNSVNMGDKAQSFIPCEFWLDGADLKVKVPSDAYNGPVNVYAASGYESSTSEITVVYDEAISVEFAASSFALGKYIEITGKNLLQVESITIKDVKVVEYALRADDAMKFAIPEGIGPGVYRLVFTLLDGTQITWSRPVEITAAYTETYIWQGEFTLAGWNSDYFGAENAFVEAEMAVGDVVRIYYDTTTDGWWGFQIYGGHWDPVALDELGGGQMVSSDVAPSGTGVYFAFTVTEALLAQLTSIQGWGGALTINGDGAIIKGVSLLKYGAAETVVWEGSRETGDYANNLELGGEDDWVNNGLTEGSMIRVYFTAADPSDWSMQLFDGHWNSIASVCPNGVQFNQDNDPDAIDRGYVEFEASGDIYTLLTTHAWWGSALIVQGKNLTITKLAFI